MYTIQNKGHTERKSHFKKRRLRNVMSGLRRIGIPIQGGVNSNLRRGDSNPRQIAIHGGGCRWRSKERGIAIPG